MALKPFLNFAQCITSTYAASILEVCEYDYFDSSDSAVGKPPLHVYLHRAAACT